jgi:co-chaperonin GroES (HSP10)
MPDPPRLRLLHDQVLVEPIRKFERFEAKSPTGLLFLPDNPQRNRSTEFFWWGRVTLVGPGDAYRYRAKLGRHDERNAYQRPDGARFPMEVKPGDVVLYERRPWGDVMLEGREYTIIHEQQHIAGFAQRMVTTGWSDPAAELKPGDRWTADLGDGRVVSGVLPNA